MIRSEDLVFQPNAIEGNGSYLVVTNGEPSPAAADKKPVYARRMNQRDERRIAQTPNPPALDVEHRQAQQFRKKEQ
jgi:hypothetical protein